MVDRQQLRQVIGWLSVLLVKDDVTFVVRGSSMSVVVGCSPVCGGLSVAALLVSPF
jgi:hypothetical protein